MRQHLLASAAQFFSNERVISPMKALFIGVSPPVLHMQLLLIIHSQSGETVTIVDRIGLPLVLSTVMKRMTDGKTADLILTTGGAGCNPGDCTPEATMNIVDRPVPGIPEAMRAHTMKLTRRSMLNRSVAGISGDTLIVNLPGKAQAVKESLRFLLPELVHAVKVIKGEA